MNIGAKIGIVTGILAVCGTVGGAAKWTHDAYYDDRYVTIASYEAAEIRKEIRQREDEINQIEDSDHMNKAEKEKQIKRLEREIQRRDKELDRLK